jgi:structural maintenance of chromosome 2
MRPPEILGLIEEAAGTRMYEERKDKATKTMAKKEKRVQEITALLEEEITPKLDTLREEKRSFLEYQKRTTEIEKLARLLRAYEWKEATERVKRKEADIQKKKAELAGMHEQNDENKEQLQLADAERKDAIKRRDKVCHRILLYGFT